MASVCGSTLSLLDAGVNLEANAAGVAMGIMKKGDDYEILTDIQGPEDHYGGMDLKVAGTRDGITAVQMDVKIEGLPEEILAEALMQAREGRLEILDEMEAEKKEAGELSSTAPKVTSLEIDSNKIRNVIGPGGKIVRQISEETGADLDIEESGEIFITADSAEKTEKAKTYVKNIVREIEPGEEFKGEVVKTTDFGAFVEIAPGRDGLVHISNLSSDYVENVEDVLEVGDKVKVKVNKVDSDGKIGFDLISTLS
jgi:polyribonucleotide nucleotidyltransferase